MMNSFTGIRYGGKIRIQNDDDGISAVESICYYNNAIQSQNKNPFRLQTEANFGPNRGTSVLPVHFTASD